MDQHQQALAAARERERQQRAKSRATLAKLSGDGSGHPADRRPDQRTDEKFYRLLDSDDLWARGVKYSRQHLHRLIRAGLFPKPIKLGSGGRNAWLADEIDFWITARISARDATA